jgi:endonuclease-3
MGSKTSRSGIVSKAGRKLNLPDSFADFKEKFLTVIKLVLKNNPQITEERNSKLDPLDLLILLVLNQSTTDELSDRAFAQMHKDYDGYSAILRENNPVKLAQSIKLCGLAPTKAQYILNVLHFLNENYDLNVKMPFINELSDAEALKELTKIKGIGVKSASCMLMFSFGRGLFPIDTHLFRVLHRLGGILSPKTTTEAAHKLLQPLVNKKEAFIGHLGLIELGRKVCKAPQKPKCDECYLAVVCDYKTKLNTNQLLSAHDEPQLKKPKLNRNRSR